MTSTLERAEINRQIAADIEAGVFDLPPERKPMSARRLGDTVNHDSLCELFLRHPELRNCRASRLAITLIENVRWLA